MPLLESERLHGDPLVVHGRTVIPIAAVRRLNVSLGPVRFVRLWARPHAVEVIEPDGEHRMIPIRDRGRHLTIGSRVIPVVMALGIRGMIARTTRRDAP
jgi:hypothetical protein